VGLRADLRRQQQLLGNWVSPSFWSKLIPGLQPRARTRKAALFSLALAFAILAWARPQWGVREELIQARGADVMLLLDVSRSMDVEDVVPSRMKKAKHWIRSLIDRLGGSRVGVVAFAASSYVACPLTTDLDYLLESIEILGPEAVVNQGTDIGLGLETAVAALERGAEAASGSEGEADLSSKAVILISDGEDHEEAVAKALGRLEKSHAKLFVLGVGTDRGGPIPVRNEAGQLDGYKKVGGSPVLSRFDSKSLESIAAKGNGRYWNMSDSEAEIDDIASALGALASSQQQEQRRVRLLIDRFQWPLGISILLFLAELALPLAALSTSGRRTSLGGLMLTVALGLGSSDARATPVGSYWKNRQGVRLFSQENWNSAATRFGDAKSADRDSLEPAYNLGVVQLKKGDAKAAVDTFESSARESAMAGDARMSARSLYNLGAAYEAEQQQGEALRSFARAARMAEIGKDEALALEARKRIQKLQEQQQSQSGKGKQDQKENQGSDSKKDQQSGQQKQKPEDQNRPQRFEDPSVSRKRPFKSDKMSQEDSERVMAEISAREKALQAKLKKQRGARQATNDKDW
jgi:Ca-activated chloride channel family protein